MSFYTESQQNIQTTFDSVRLAERLEKVIITDHVPESHQPFIESRDFFFLATVNAQGEPTVSHKGGPVGLVSVVDPKTLIFPSYDGNGMFLSMGNIADTGKIGMLFIDFETPHRVRVQATATASANDPLISRYPGAQLLVRAKVDQVFVNCGRYIHKYKRVAESRYVPDKNGEAPFPAWKRIDSVQDALPSKDMDRATHEGGTITQEEYVRMNAAGEV